MSYSFQHLEEAKDILQDSIDKVDLLNNTTTALLASIAHSLICIAENLEDKDFSPTINVTNGEVVKDSSWS